VLVANALYLAGVFDANPLGPRSGLVSGITPGPLRGQPTIDPNNGFISQALSHRAVLDLLHLHFPWWDPFQGTGMPLAADMQSAALFPLTLLTALSNGQLYEHVLLEILAGISTYLLLRRIAIGRWASAGGGIAFALNGTFAWFAHATVNPVAFLPLTLLGLELAYTVSVEGRSGGWWLIALSGALSFYAGFPEVAYIDALLAVCWFGWRCVGLSSAQLVAFVRKALTATLVGVSLCAPLLIAMIDYFGHADLWLHSTDFFAHVHVPAQGLPQLVLPYVYGPILGFSDPKFALYGIWVNVGGYLTTSLLVLALVGLLSRRHRRLAFVLAGWIVLMLARTYDLVSPLSDLVNVLPGMSRVAVFRYASASVELAVIVLAALGLDELSRAAWSRRTGASLAAACLAVVAVAAVGARPLADHLGSSFSHRPYFLFAVGWGAAVVLLLGGTMLVRNARVRGPVATLILVGDALLLFALPELSAPRAVQVDNAPVAFLQHHLGSSRFFTLGPFAPNYGSYLGLSSLNANDVPVPSAFARFVSARLDHVVDPTSFVGTYGGGRPLFAPSPQQELLANLPGYREAGVAYVLTPAGQSLPEAGTALRLVLHSPSTWIYHLAGAAPYFTTTDRQCTMASGGRSSVSLVCSAPATLIRRETDLPGWSAAIDGRSVPIRSDDGVFQAVAVPAGSHRVDFSYEPPGVVLGFLVFGLGCVWLLVPPMGLLAFRRDRGGHDPAGPKH
jgi:Bacterial membrane protein YfhO